MEAWLGTSRIVRELATLFIHLAVTFARLLGPDGLRSVIAESLVAKHQLLILNRSRERAARKMHLRLTFPSPEWCKVSCNRTNPVQLIRPRIHMSLLLNTFR